MTTQSDAARSTELAAARGSAVAIAIHDIERLEAALKPAVELARLAHSSTMRASEAIGNEIGTGSSHACLALMEIATRTLHAADDAARYARHSMTYPPNHEGERWLADSNLSKGSRR